VQLQYAQYFRSAGSYPLRREQLEALFGCVSELETIVLFYGDPQKEGRSELQALHTLPIYPRLALWIDILSIALSTEQDNHLI
jgi:hypothetical protein